MYDSLNLLIMHVQKVEEKSVIRLLSCHMSNFPPGFHENEVPNKPTDVSENAISLLVEVVFG